jgi:hypothetical protein
MSTNTDFDPALWLPAFERVEKYLRALRITSRHLRVKFAREIIRAAVARHALEPRRTSLDIAMTEARRLVRENFGRVRSLPRDSRVRRSVAPGRAVRWPAREAVAQPQQQIADAPSIAHAISEARAPAAPQITARVGMAPRPLDLGPVSRAAGVTLRLLRCRPVLRYAMTCTLVMSVLGTALYLTSF